MRVRWLLRAGTTFWMYNEVRSRSICYLLAACFLVLFARLQYLTVCLSVSFFACKDLADGWMGESPLSCCSLAFLPADAIFD